MSNTHTLRMPKFQGQACNILICMAFFISLRGLFEQYPMRGQLKQSLVSHTAVATLGHRVICSGLISILCFCACATFLSCLCVCVIVMALCVLCHGICKFPVVSRASDLVWKIPQAEQMIPSQFIPFLSLPPPCQPISNSNYA